MLDYKALSSLHAVLKFQSFDKAAEYLHLTQSAVSQNIKRLEQECGRPLLIRARPVIATPLGEQLLAHFNKVTMLEEGLQETIQGGQATQPINIAVNNDVLATWFTEVVDQFSAANSTKLHIKAADQAKTRALLQTGEVVACVSQIGTPVSGGESIFLGNMHYELVATPSFIKEHLKGDLSAAAVLKSPSLIYDEHDELWGRYQNECLKVKTDISHSHWYPSSHGFVELVMGGTVCALIPSIQIKQKIKSKKLVSLLPNKRLDLPLYWHWYKLNSPVLDRLTKVIKNVTRDAL
ncbi:ArgP/LysG family DNA-binding transcriptional regulator [Marinomonas rhizomae]|uniref:LysR family transcriptional regulator (Chromosome initiation inhibitor) n=1 Tax=Marinomonas rhizomae TaxID=491948 RepID=A0A366J3U0_9GAMM|nr:ArgP/LysG family DNA-binding transcriptional regulator [Marinomonas rhizomae]RBP81703.1 LysR family transcriptional regulator (chromosome initiation inhibitor) [Marinomonas rhizomae]RNF72833.1 ArgP/LysG family DNA-binding transcriptional regulator [Marinomonas rhizomae]